MTGRVLRASRRRPRSLHRHPEVGAATVVAALAFPTPVSALAPPAAPTAAPRTQPSATEPAADPGEPANDRPAHDELVNEEPPGVLPPDQRPPRLDGPYVGAMLFTGIGLTRVNGLDTGPFAAFGGSLRFGEMVLPWLGLGLAVGGGGGVGSGDARQRLGQGQLAVDLTFVPAHKKGLPLSLRTAFGFGGGAVRQDGAEGRAGYGGAMFGAALGYTFFPWAHNKRPYRGGGFGLGPELGWIGFTPPAKGRPMSNTIYLALNFAFYFGA